MLVQLVAEAAIDPVLIINSFQRLACCCSLMQRLPRAPLTWQLSWRRRWARRRRRGRLWRCDGQTPQPRVPLALR